MFFGVNIQTEQPIGGILSFEFGTNGEVLGVLDIVLISLASVVAICILIWLVKVRPRTPQNDAEWNSDCEFLTTTTAEGNTITFRNVRDFFWRTTRDRDEAWEDEVVVDVEELKDIWFMVDHFHSIHGMAHTYLTFEFNDGTCLSFSFEARRRVKQRYHPWAGLSACPCRSISSSCPFPFPCPP